MAPRHNRLAVIGDPIAHSLSPEIQNAALRDLELSYTYVKIRVRPQNLKSFIKKTAPNLMGFNCTVPLKEEVMPFLHWISPQAKMIGAVNTVVNRNGNFYGFNTDGSGYQASLEEDTGFIVNQKRVVLLGAGGAARALSMSLARAGAKQIALCNRTNSRAKTLVKDLKKYFPKPSIYSAPIEGPLFSRVLKSADLLINTTTIGMAGSRFADFPFDHLPKKALVSDIVYAPRMTPFLKDAKKASLAIHTGEGMLVHQGALAFLLWTGRIPNTQLMRRVLLRSLRNQS